MDQEINNMLIGTVSEIRTENVIDFDPANGGIISNASDGQTKEEAANKGKKRKITNIEGKNKKDAATTESENLKEQEIKNMMITVSEMRTEDEGVTDSDSEDDGAISNESDGQLKDKTMNRNKKQKVTSAKGKNKKDAAMTKSKNLKDQEIAKNVMIENTAAVSDLSTSDVTDSDAADDGAISNKSDRETEDETVVKNKKRKITKKGKKNDDAPMTKSKNLKKKDDALMTKSKNLKKKDDALMTESKKLKKKDAHPPTSEMVMTSIKSLRKRKGASVEDISKYMEEKYAVNVKRLKLHINRFLEKSVEGDVLEKASGKDDEERFKIKKADKAKKTKQSLKHKDGKKKLKKSNSKQVEK